jgi:hypothetical protein
MNTEDLKVQIKRHESNITHGQAIIDSNKAPLESYKAQLAALEAQERKPREFLISKTSLGKYQCAPADEFTHFLIGDNTNPVIHAIEKLPVKVTREMASNMYEYMICRIASNHPAYMAGLIKAAGIDAEPSND